MTKKYRHLLFDLDGTLTDPMEGITRSVQHALRHFGIEVSDLRELCPFIGPPFAESFRTFYGFDDRQTSEAVAVSREYFTEKGIFENRLYDGMDELLDTLTSSVYPLLVSVSSSSTRSQAADIRSASPRRSPGYSPSGSSTTSASPPISPSSAAQDWTARCRRRPM